MTTYLFDPAPIQSLPVLGANERFPVRRIYCVGRNYTEHIVEMGGNLREHPFFFQKPADALVQDGATVPYPSCTDDFQHEVELVLAIGSDVAGHSEEAAREAVFGYAVGIDLTRRDVQVAARKAGRPWEIGKSFDHSAPCSAIVPLTHSQLPAEGALMLEIGGQARQQGDIRDMIWKPLEIIAKLSEQYALKAGDIVYTGTPAGVGPIARGDRLVASFDDLCHLSIQVA